MRISTKELTKNYEAKKIEYTIEKVFRDFKACEESGLWLGNNSCQGSCSNCNYCYVEITVQ